MKVRVTNPAENPGCATCGVGVPKPPEGGGTSRDRRAWANSQVGGAPMANPGGEPQGHAMARQFRPRASARKAPSLPYGWAPRTANPNLDWAANRTSWGGGQYNRSMSDPMAVVNASMLPTMAPMGPARAFANPGVGPVGLALRAAGVVPTGHAMQANPPPLTTRWIGGPRSGRKRLRGYWAGTEYAVFGPGASPYGGYGGGSAPAAPGVPVAYPLPPPGLTMSGQGCYTSNDCAPDEYCHGGICMPDPAKRNVGVTQTQSIAGVPVGNPALNPGAPMTQMTQSLAPPGFAVR